MKTSFKHYMAGVSVALALVPTADAAYNTHLIYGKDAYEALANNSYNRFQTEADSCYNALISVSSPAALAGFYRYEFESFLSYYRYLGQSWQFYFYKLGYVDLPNLANYLEQSRELISDFGDAAESYARAYSGSSTVIRWGGNQNDEADLSEYQLEHIYGIHADIYNAVHPSFQGSYYQYKLVYEGVSIGVFDVYMRAGDLVRALYRAVSDPTADAKAQVYYDLAFSESGVWLDYARYYEWLAIASE